MVITGFSMAKDLTDDFLSMMGKYVKSNNISIEGESFSYIQKSDVPVMQSDFSIKKCKGNTLYEDKYHTIIMKPLYDIWVDYSGKFIYLSYKVPNKQQSGKFMNPSNIFEMTRIHIKNCTVKNNATGGKEYTITYNPVLTDCIKSIVVMDKEENLKRIEYYFSEGTYLSKTVINYNSISTDPVNIEMFNEDKYLIKKDNKWITAKAYKNYKIHIFEYEKLF